MAAGRRPFGGGAQGFGAFADIFDNIFGEFMDPRGQRANAARGADLRYDMELTLEEAFAGSEQTITIEALAKCEPCDGRGSRGDSRPATCRTCGGAGKVRAQQGFFVVERGCPTCQGCGRDDRRSVHRLRRRRPHAQAPQSVGQDPGRGRRRHPHPRGGRGRGGDAQCVVRRPLYFRPYEAPRDLRARGHDPDRRMSRSASPPRLWAGRSPCPASTAPGSTSRSPPESSRASNCASAAPA